MNTEILFWSSSSLWGVAAALAGWYCAFMARQITYATLADGRRQVRDLPILFKIMIPLTPNFFPFVSKPAFAKMRDNAERRILAAGFHGVLSAEEFLSLKLVMPIVIGLIWFMFAWLLVNSVSWQIIQSLSWLIFLIGPLWLYIYPDAWLRRVLTERHNSIRKALPFVLDMLTLSVEAGMDFMTALQRHVERKVVDPLSEELLLVIREIQLGKTRREALRDMSQRVNLPDLRTVVTALVQADELGVSIGAILRIQSDQMRQRRFERAERLANEAPVKMLGPLLLFIFPAVFLVLLGPIFVKLMHSGF
jgi:tight adherence protein C